MKLRLTLLIALCFSPLILHAAERWQPLWDGKTLAGWHVSGKGVWKIEDGALHGTQVKTEKEYGHLVTDKVYGDFTVRLKFKSLLRNSICKTFLRNMRVDAVSFCHGQNPILGRGLKGNSGLYFRIAEKGFSGVTGFQAEIDATKDVGGLYETNGRSWVSQPTPAQVATWFKPGEWNEMTVSAKGGHITVHVNGKKTAELPDDPGRKEGKFALQVHGGQDCDVWFKDIEILLP